MSEVWAKVKLQMPVDVAYKLVEIAIKQLFDFEDHWPVEKYDPDKNCIEFKEVTANYDDVVGFATVLKEKLDEFADSKEGDARDALRRIPFTMYGTVRYVNSGEKIECIIEKEEEDLVIKK